MLVSCVTLSLSRGPSQFQSKSDQIGVRSKERWGQPAGRKKLGEGAATSLTVPEIRKCDAPSHPQLPLQLRQSTYSIYLGRAGHCWALLGRYLGTYIACTRPAPPLGAALCKVYAAPESPLPTSIVTRLHLSKVRPPSLPRPPYIQQLTAAPASSSSGRTH